jgi:imidazolonepropionase-like amidohydrolase
MRSLAALLLVVGLGVAKVSGDEVAVRCGKILTMNGDDQIIDNGWILIRDGKITAVGKQGEVKVPEGITVLDGSHLWAVPGFIEGHNHVGGSLWDLNDGVFLTNPDLRSLDAVAPGNDNMKTALAGGVTTVLLIPGSGNNMSGTGTLLKGAGETLEDVVVRYPGSLKIAQAGNPERYWFGVRRAYMNYNTRQTLKKMRAYHDRWTAYEEKKTEVKPDYDPFLHDLRGLFRGEFPASVHTQIYQVVMMTILMLNDEFGIKAVLDHSTFDGYKNARLIVERDMSVINGPRQVFLDSTRRRLNGCAAMWWGGGVRRLSINTDSPVIPEEELSFQAAMACRYGWEPYAALRGLTIEPARALGIDDRLGSLEPGKDADLGLWTGDPIDPRSECTKTLIDGKVVYDGSKKRRF